MTITVLIKEGEEFRDSIGDSNLIVFTAAHLEYEMLSFTYSKIHDPQTLKMTKA